MTTAAVMLAVVVAAQSVVMALAMRLIRRQAAEIERLREDNGRRIREASNLRAIAIELRNRIY